MCFVGICPQILSHPYRIERTLQTPTRHLFLPQPYLTSKGPLKTIAQILQPTTFALLTTYHYFATTPDER